MTGTIKTLNREKLFGFIRPTSGPEYFFHSSDLAEDNWNEVKEAFLKGEQIRVEFEPNKTPKGMRARNVVMLASGYE